MKITASILCAVSLALLNGCVYVTQPVGKKPHPLNKAEWEGMWQFDRSVALISVTDAPGGWLKVVCFGKEKDEADVRTFAVRIMETDGWLTANVRDPEATPERYTWMYIKRDDGLVLAWEPSLDEFGTLVREGKLRGTTKGHDVMLEPLDADALCAIRTGKYGVVFDWEKPAIFRRIAR